jgi:hypothetical protein
MTPPRLSDRLRKALARDPAIYRMTVDMPEGYTRLVLVSVDDAEEAADRLDTLETARATDLDDAVNALTEKIAELATTRAERDALREALKAVRPTGRGNDCWCEESRDIQQFGHATKCHVARAAIQGCGCGVDGGLKRYCDEHNPCFAALPRRAALGAPSA